MQIILTNVKATLALQGLDPDTDQNAIIDKCMSILPYMQGYSYDPDNDMIILDTPIVIPSTLSEIGEVAPGDYTVG
jgi:hypothetical protein